MRVFLASLAISLMAWSQLAAQWLETVIPFTENHWPGKIAYSTVSNRAYTGGDDDSLYVIDGATNAVVARLYVGELCEALLYHSGGDKVYRLGRMEQLDVIACGMDSVLKRIQLPGDRMVDMCHNTLGNKLYCTSRYSNEVIVVDCDSDVVTMQVPVGDGPEFVCYNPTRNKAYVSHSDKSIAVICGAGDSVLATIDVGYRPSAICYNQVNDKVYCAATDGDLLVISGTGDSVQASLPVRAVALCYNAVSNKVYAGGRQGVVVIDAAADTVLGVVPVSGTSLFHNPMNNKVYCATWNYGGIAVIDGVGDTLIKEIEVPVGSYGSMAWNSAHNRVYAPFGAAVSGVAVLSDSWVGVEETPTAEVPLPNHATVIRGNLLLTHTPSSTSGSLLDISGRKVLDLHTGRNDVSRLSPGVYFIRSGISESLPAETKVVVQR